ncbi:OsmC family protein [Chryseosolibacter indicus]|uniref:OsmC family protein n=1 Tax=Chryseosolibacter indicus TaxID=2782351 RepID=A0ABS5VNW9_9BACT|nr:OsmC family protein [Chryseosolibacter indicus]MBT1702487.1 OsmC family protein [Chryseosolibacter indicus]
MIITATIKNSYRENNITVSTDNNEKKITIPGKTEGYGSSVNGGELLFLSLATCFCNDIYREAAKRKMIIDSVEVFVSGNFGKEGEPGSNIVYETKVKSSGNSQQEIDDLIHYVDTIAEIHNTLRKGVSVTIKNQK